MGASPPPSKRRRSRFAPSASPIPSQPQPNAENDVPSADQGAKPRRFANASVAALRAQISQGRPPPPSSGSAPKRRRTSRFGQAQTAVPSHTPADFPPSSLPIDVASIPVAPVSTLRINQNVAQKKRLESVLRVSEGDLLETDPALNPYYDAAIRLPPRPQRAPRSQFQFVQQGKIVEKAEKQREKAVADAKVAQYRAKLVEKREEEDVLPVLPPLAEDLHVKGDMTVPSAEWWDMPFLARKECREGNVNSASWEGDDGGIAIREDRITHYVHHPPPIAPAIPEKPLPALPLMLTKKERKKLRRQRRMEAQKEKQELIAVGLMPPPPPKVKLSNLVRVLANEASADPTKVEAKVRAEVDERRRKHEADNQARKKTKLERREKEHTKMERDKECGLHAAVFRVTSMSNPQHRFKVHVNATQLEMSGGLFLFPDCNIVVVEGGLKSVRKYKKLMLRRIDWNSAASGTGGSAQNSSSTQVTEHDSAVDVSIKTCQSNRCILVWEGSISSAAFGPFVTENARNQREGRYHFRKHGVEHYWDLCTQANPAGNENLGVRQIM